MVHHTFIMLFLKTQRVLWVRSWHLWKKGGMIWLPSSDYFYRCLHLPIFSLVKWFLQLSLWTGDSTYLQYIIWGFSTPWIFSLSFILTTMYPVYCSYLLLSVWTFFTRLWHQWQYTVWGFSIGWISILLFTDLYINCLSCRSPLLGNECLEFQKGVSTYYQFLTSLESSHCLEKCSNCDWFFPQRP